MKNIVLILLYLTSGITYSQTEENPRVINIYPTTDSIPVNVLRFYIEFSKPMQEMNILNHIHLLNSKGENLTGVFYENQYELWNKNRTMVTIIIDPGRVKMGLYANKKMGRAFDKGVNYTLSIDSLLLDFENNTLENSFTKTFTAVEEDKKPPSMLAWKIELPKPNTKAPITIYFNDCIDHVSAHSFVKIIRNQKEVVGTISHLQAGWKWEFIPNLPWNKGAYTLISHTALEDIAANSLEQIFDHQTDEFNTAKKTTSIKFRIK